MKTLSTGNSFLKPSTSDSYFILTKVINIYKSNDYDRFCNWLSGEFTLYLQEEADSLKVYFPNGWFICEKIKSIEGIPKVRIVIKSKCQKCGNKIKVRVESMVNHFNSSLKHL